MRNSQKGSSLLSNSIYWLHDDCLRPGPAFPSVYVFDVAKLEREAWSLKRIGFIYECLLELDNVEIRKGDPIVQVADFAKAHNATRIVTLETPDPLLQAQQQALARSFTMQIELPEPFVELRGRVDLKRFSRYWQKAQGPAMRP